MIKLVEERPDIMLKELSEILGVAINTICHSLKVLGYTRKKMARYKKKRHYKKWCRSYLTKLERFKRHDIVYMDKIGFSPGTSRSHGYSLQGKRIYGDVDSQKRPRTCLIGAYRNNKPIAPPFCNNGNCNTAVFNEWLTLQGIF